MVSSFSKAFRPTALAFRARSARSALLNLMRLPRRRSFSNRFSACRYSMTISCCRWIQPDTTINKNVSSGGTEPMPKVYRSCRPSIWTARGRHEGHGAEPQGTAPIRGVTRETTRLLAGAVEGGARAQGDRDDRRLRAAAHRAGERGADDA